MLFIVGDMHRTTIVLSFLSVRIGISGSYSPIEQDLVLGLCTLECSSTASITCSCTSTVLPVHKNFT